MNQPYRNIKNDYSAALFERPNESLDHLAEQIKQDLREEVAPHLADMQKNRTRDFWVKFFQWHPELNTEMGRTVAQIVLNENYADLADEPLSDALDQIARLTQKRITYIEEHSAEERERAAYQGGPGDESGHLAAEQGAYGARQRQEKSLSGAIKHKRELRRQAARGRYVE
jgi:hypothetical protein